MCISLMSLGLAIIMKDVAEYRPEINHPACVIATRFP